jgi:phenylacetate-coenzyme A ligase PaaK-like adenylate-forming protein
VLDWALKALAGAGKAVIATYASSATQLAGAAERRGVRLDGLVLMIGGEPVTPAKRRAIEAVGAAAVDVYAFTQLGTAAMACPHTPNELHVMEQALAVVPRRRVRTDGVVVDALLWTTLRPDARNVLVNVENDDYGTLSVDGDACPCWFGRLGLRQRVSGVRGMSKMVAGGVTVKGEVFEELAETTLPDRFGGRSGDYQFIEEQVGHETRLVLRVHPRLPAVDEEAVLAVVAERLRQTETGRLADDVWSAQGAVRVVRSEAVRTRAGKILPYETLR